jgi:hypothetical protein
MMQLYFSIFCALMRGNEGRQHLGDYGRISDAAGDIVKCCGAGVLVQREMDSSPS